MRLFNCLLLVTAGLLVSSTAVASTDCDCSKVLEQCGASISSIGPEIQIMTNIKKVRAGNMVCRQWSTQHGSRQGQTARALRVQVNSVSDYRQLWYLCKYSPACSQDRQHHKRVGRMQKAQSQPEDIQKVLHTRQDHALWIQTVSGSC